MLRQPCSWSRTTLSDQLRSWWIWQTSSVCQVRRKTRGLSGAELVVSEKSGQIVAASDEAFRELPRGVAVQDSRRPALGPTVQVAGERYFYVPVELDRRPLGGRLVLLHIFYPE